MNSLAEQLQELRRLLEGADGPRVELFDEFVQQREFDLALHVICYFLLDSGLKCLGTSEVEQIRLLHRAMNIEDSCVDDLQNIAAHRSAY